MLNSKECNSHLVLVIEDDPWTRLSYCCFLRQGLRCHYEVIEAGAEFQPVALLKQAIPDVIVLSTSSQHVENVLEILGFFEQQDSLLKTPVILVIDEEDLAVVAKVLDSGISDCLCKPELTPITLCRSVHNAIERFQLNAELEQRVQQRTSELAQINQKLIAEITEHQKTEFALRLRVERLNNLYHLVIALNRASTIEDIYTAALNGVRRVLKTSCAAILVPDSDGIPRYRASLGISDAYKQAVENYLTATQNQINPKTVVISNVTQRLGIETLDLMRESEGIQSSASFPLRYQSQDLGKVVVYYDAPHQFTAEEIKLAKTIAIYVATAITRKQSEEALQQINAQLATTNSELARATRLKDEFLANMSHEFRTPLNAILGLSDGLLDEVYGSLNDRQKRSLSSIERSGQHLLELVNDILDLAKIEAGKLELQISSISPKALCESSLSFVRQMAAVKEIQLTLILPDEIENIRADERRLRQVLINLLSNAVKFTYAGGQVTLEASSDSETQSLFLTVTDTGIGIAPEDIPKLFQSFVQIDSALNRTYPGTGLGLSLVQRIVDLHRGEITVESQVNQGSQFRIRLPYS